MKTRHYLLLLFLAASALLPEISAQLANCQNFGTPINSTDCQCPGYVDGRLCDNIKCQRWAVPDKNRCACAPGWYDRYCGLRGCRPPNEEQMDLEKRSFIIVFNTKTTMKMQLDTLKNNFKAMIANVTQSSKGVVDNWIDNYIVYGFVQSGSDKKIQSLFTDGPNGVFNFLNKMTLSKGDDAQPVLTAIADAQQTFPKMKSHALVLVFTDSPASDATAWSHRFTQNNPEQVANKISLLWRAKYSIFLSLPTNKIFEGDSTAVYQRLSFTNYGDFFNIQTSDDLSKALLFVIGVQYFPENVQVGYGKNTDEQITTYVDNDGDMVYFLITTDWTWQEKLGVIQGATLVAEGSSYRLYSRASKMGDQLTISNPPGTSYNYRVFIQSKNSILFNHVDDMHIDVGNGMAAVGMQFYSTMRAVGFSQWKNITCELRSFDGTFIRAAQYANERVQEDCTFPYGFPGWNSMECPPGPIMQVHTIYFNGYKQQRASPAYCVLSDSTPEFPDGIVQEQPSLIASQDDSPQCSQRNIDVINDPRLYEPSQFIFILEQHSGNQQVYQTLVKEISQIIGLINSTTATEYLREFTLIAHDSAESHVLFSSYNPDIFVEKFPKLVNSLKLADNLDNTMGLLSIIHAQKMNILPTAQVYYFTNQAVKNVQNLTRNWDLVKRDIEINFFTIADGVTTEIFALPKQLELVQKMTNGRLIPLGKTESSILPIFKDMMTVTTLTTDNEQYNCHDTALEINGYFEDGADFSVVQVVGTGLKTIKMQDSNGALVSVSDYVTYKNLNFMSFRIDSKLFASGVWKLSALSTTGGCQITVRQKTSVGLVLGFTDVINDDNVSTQIISQRSSSGSQPIITTLKATNNIVPTDLEIQIVNRQRYDQPVSYKKLAIAQRDSTSCSYNFISESVVVPKSELTTWTVSANDNAGKLILHRIYYYYQHIPADATVCHGGKVDQYGRCICPPRYTGDYCWDRVCDPAATYSFGICNCPHDMYGEFCEILLVLPTNATTVSPIQTTTKSAQLSFNVVTAVLLCIFKYLF